MIWLIYIIPIFGLIALLYSFIKSKWIYKQDPGSERMIEISNYIREGAIAFFKNRI